MVGVDFYVITLTLNCLPVCIVLTVHIMNECTDGVWEKVAVPKKGKGPLSVTVICDFQFHLCSSKRMIEEQD